MRRSRLFEENKGDFQKSYAKRQALFGAIPYGFLPNNGDVNDLIIDEDAAVNVRRIFQLVIDGKGVYQIANILTADKVLIPSAQLPFRRVRTAFL
jgi:hypothetical protein